MDKRLLFKFRLVGAIFLLLSAVCFIINLPTINKPLIGMSTTHIVISVLFWLGMIGFYATFYYFSVKYKAYNLYKGNGRVKPALFILLFSMLTAYLRFHVINHISIYEMLLILTVSSTYGILVLVAIAVVLVKLRLRKYRQTP